MAERMPELSEDEIAHAIKGLEPQKEVIVEKRPAEESHDIYTEPSQEEIAELLKHHGVNVAPEGHFLVDQETEGLELGQNKN